MSSGARLPGEDIVAQGLSDLAAGRRSAPAMLVQAARPRLERLGLAIAPPSDPPSPSAEIRLYRILRAEHPRDAYSRYNALLRQITSYARALEHQSKLHQRQLDGETNPAVERAR